MIFNIKYMGPFFSFSFYFDVCHHQNCQKITQNDIRSLYRNAEKTKRQWKAFSPNKLHCESRGSRKYRKQTKNLMHETCLLPMYARESYFLISTFKIEVTDLRLFIGVILEWRGHSAVYKTRNLVRGIPISFPGINSAHVDPSVGYITHGVFSRFKAHIKISRNQI
jgi:hypothetical protein